MAALNDIMKLVNAGFTKDEIMAMTAEPEKKETPADPEPEKEADPEPAPAPEKKPEAPAPAEPEQKSQFDILLGKIQELSNQVITNNINTQSMDGSQRKTDEDILAAVINPPRAEKKGR